VDRAASVHRRRRHHLGRVCLAMWVIVMNLICDGLHLLVPEFRGGQPPLHSRPNHSVDPDHTDYAPLPAGVRMAASLDQEARLTVDEAVPGGRGWNSRLRGSRAACEVVLAADAVTATHGSPPGGCDPDGQANQPSDVSAKRQRRPLRFHAGHPVCSTSRMRA